MANAPHYVFNVADKPSLSQVEVPLIKATVENLSGYGCLVDDPADFSIEIVRCPATT